MSRLKYRSRNAYSRRRGCWTLQIICDVTHSVAELCAGVIGQVMKCCVSFLFGTFFFIHFIMLL